MSKSNSTKDSVKSLFDKQFSNERDRLTAILQELNNYHSELLLEAILSKGIRLFSQRVELVKTFIRMGADVDYRKNNKNDDTPIILAMKNNVDQQKTPLILQALIDGGANLTLKNSEGKTALIVAIETFNFSDNKFIEILSKTGVAINTLDPQSRSPLGLLIETDGFSPVERLDSIKQLIKAGANVNYIRPNGDSILDLVIKTPNDILFFDDFRIDILKELIDNGAIVTQKTVELAEKYQTTETLIQLLKDNVSSQKISQQLCDRCGNDAKFKDKTLNVFYCSKICAIQEKTH